MNLFLYVLKIKIKFKNAFLLINHPFLNIKTLLKDQLLL